MARFSVLVVTETDNEAELAAAMEPFQLNTLGECNKKYLEFYDAEVEDKEDYETGRNDEGIMYHQVYSTIEEFFVEELGYEVDGKTGKYGYWENPNGKWASYSIGGNWAGLIQTIDGKKVSHCLKGKIDPEFVRADALQKAEQHWDRFMKREYASVPKSKVREFIRARPEESREEYSNRQSSECNLTFAIIKDGVWCWGWYREQYACSTGTAEHAVEGNLYHGLYSRTKSSEYVWVVDYRW